MANFYRDRMTSVPHQVGPAVVDYPFLNYPTPDRYSRNTTRRFTVLNSAYDPTLSNRTNYTNLLLQSNTLNAAPWTVTRATTETNGTLAPDKSVAWRLVEDNTVAATHYIEQSGIVIAAGPVVRYVMAKAAQRSRINLALVGDVSVAQGFDLLTGQIYANGLGMLDPEAAIIFPLGDGWFFCGLRQTFATGVLAQTFLDDGTGVTYDGDGASGLYLANDNVLNSDRFGPVILTIGETRTISAPSLDPGDNLVVADPLAYLCAEDSPPSVDEFGVARFARTFSRIPPAQSVPGSLSISKPAVPGDGSLPRLIGDYFVRQQFLPNIWDAYFRVATAGDSGVPAFYPTAGTYQLNYNGDVTGALAFDASASDLETELNLLPQIAAMGGVTVTGAYNNPSGLIITWNAYATATGDVTGLTAPTGVTISFAAFSSVAGFTQLIEITPQQDNPMPSASDSFTPAGATPLTIFLAGTNGFDLYLGNYLNSTAATGGAFTVTLWGDTSTSLNYNDSMGTILAAVNAIPAVAARGSFTALNIGPIHGVPVYRFTFSNISITGGTYTLTMFGQTTAAIAYNANLAAISAALNLLSEVTARGGATASEYHPTGSVDPGPGNAYNGRQIYFKLQFGNQAFTADATGLTPPTTIGIFNGDGGIRQVQTLAMSSAATRVLNMPGHPIQTGQECFIPVASAAGFVIAGTRVTRVDADTVSYTVSASDADKDVASIIEFDPLTKRGYRPGAATIACSKTTQYFLPGVTFGIQTINDIPIPASESDTDTFLQRAFSGQGEINWQVGELIQWKGPILALSKTTIRASDV